MQAVVLLMPDENREALQTLLLFLNDVAQESSINQVIIDIYFRVTFQIPVRLSE